MEINLCKQEMESIAYTLKALANANRLMIVASLSNKGEMNVSDICEKLQCTQPLISHHLTDMHAKGILKMRREGRNMYYSLENNRVIEVISCISECKL